MTRIWAITINTFREAVRDKVLYGVIGLATAVLLLTLMLAELSLNQQQRVILDIGLASISLLSVMTAIFLGSSLLHKEIERKTLYVILPKPISRAEFLLGKYFGIVITVLTFVAIMGALQLWIGTVKADGNPVVLVGLAVGAVASLALLLRRAADRTFAFLPWSLSVLAAMAGLSAAYDAPVTPVLAALWLNSCEVLLISAVALLFSSFSTPFLTGSLSFGVWLVGRSADEMASMESSALPESVRSLLHGLAQVIPNFHLFVPGHHALSGEVPLEYGLLGYLGVTTGYVAAYTTLLLLAGILIFRRRNLI